MENAQYFNVSCVMKCESLGFDVNQKASIQRMACIYSGGPELCRLVEFVQTDVTHRLLL